MQLHRVRDNDFSAAAVVKDARFLSAMRVRI
jgi:hypothetical protein